MTLKDKIIDINNFKTDIIDDDIGESRIYFEDTRDVKRELRKPKELSCENRTQWEDSIYNYFASGGNSHGMPLSYIIRKDISVPEERGNRYVQIIYQASLLGNMFTGN